MVVPFPIAYLGSISYFKTLIQQPNVAFEIWDHFPKQTFRNRAQIRDAQGLQLLTLPVERPYGSKTCTKDIQVSYQQNWQQIHWRAIRTAYAAAPFFEHYENDILKLTTAKHRFLLDFHEQFLCYLLEHLQLSLNFNYTSSYEFNNSIQTDFRNWNFEELGTEKTYTQVIFPNTPFFPTVSILDALFNLGPMSRNLII